MHSQRHPIASLALVTLACLALHAHAGAHDVPLTRAQVVAQYEDAVRTGDLPAPGDSGKKLNELYPDRYLPAAATVPSTSRAQVVAELEAARRSGDLLAPGDSGLKLNELYPDRYAAQTAVAVAAKTREQVRAETREAIRTGDILATGDSGLKLNEEFPQRYAKARADKTQRIAGIDVTLEYRDSNR